MSSGSKQTIPTSTYQAQSTIAPLAEPYAREQLEGLRATLFGPSGQVIQQPQYTGERFMNPQNLDMFWEYRNNVGSASTLPYNTAQDETIYALDTGKYRTAYGPGEFQSGYQPWQYSPSNFQAQSVMAPELSAPQHTQVATVDTSGFPGVSAPGLAAPERISAGQSSVGRFIDPGVSQAYMSPYAQAVTDLERQYAIQEHERQRAARDARAVQAGAFGGDRAKIAEAEAERALGMQLQDITTRGAQNAFTQAQQQYERDRGASLASQQMNISSALQAALANQQAGMTSGIRGAELGLQAQLANQGVGLQAALANQQALENAASRNLSAQLQTQGLAAGQDVQTQLANQQAQMALQQLGEQSKQFGATYGEGSAQTKAQMDLQAALETERARQAAEGIRLSGGQMVLQSAQELSRQRELEQALNTRTLAPLRDYLALQQQYGQQGLDAAYQDYLYQRDYPLYAYGLYGNAVRGLPVQPTTYMSTYEGPGNPFSQVAGLGLSALGLR